MHYLNDWQCSDGKIYKIYSIPVKHLEDALICFIGSLLRDPLIFNLLKILMLIEDKIYLCQLLPLTTTISWSGFLPVFTIVYHFRSTEWKIEFLHLVESMLFIQVLSWLKMRGSLSDFSEEKLKDTVGLQVPKIVALNLA